MAENWRLTCLCFRRIIQAALPITNNKISVASVLLQCYVNTGLQQRKIFRMIDKAKNTDTREYPGLPRVAVGAIVIRDGKVLLVKRGHPPALDFWSIPGGAVKLGEPLEKAAEREVFEETGIVIKARKPIYPFDVIIKDEEGNIEYHYVILDFIGEYISGELRPADDVTDARWFTPRDLSNKRVTSTTTELLKEIGFLKH